MSDHSADYAASRWRGMSNHNVRRFTANGPVLAPCFCWASDQHDLGDEWSIPPTKGDER